MFNVENGIQLLNKNRRDSMPEVEFFKVQNHKFEVNNNILTASIENKIIPLTPAEFAIFHYLIHHQRKLITKREIETRVLNLRLDRNGDICSGSYSCYSHIAGIRRKLNKIKEGLGKEIIVTRRKLGWYLDNECQYQH